MKAADRLDKLLKSATSSGLGLKKFNIIMKRVIPFNGPHKIHLIDLSPTGAQCGLPYTRKNLNHLKGIHACALATVAEYTSGLFILNKVGSGTYRIIMRSLRMEYHYQAKKDVIATFKFKEQEFQEKVMSPLRSEGVCFHVYQVELHDSEQNHIATAYIEWQLKDWNETRTSSTE